MLIEKFEKIYCGKIFQTFLTKSLKNFQVRISTSIIQFKIGIKNYYWKL